MAELVRQSGACANYTSFSNCTTGKAGDESQCLWYVCQGSGYCLKQNLLPLAACGNDNTAPKCVEYARENPYDYYGNNYK